jgi:hypothetical protein
MAPEQEEVGEGYSSKDKCITDPVLECQKLIELGDSLFENFEYTCPEEYVYASLIPYYRAVKLLSTSRVFPYYERSLEKLPIPEDMDGFRKIGIYSYKAGGKMCYRIDFSFDISCSQYLFEINCSPGLRSRYINGAKHYMPWDKLLWMISGIKKKWNVIDDAKSAGLLLLFYGAYRNHMGLEGDFRAENDIIMLSGNLLHMSNERDYYIRNMLQGNFEFNYINRAREVRELALRCIDGLLKIREIK